MKQILLFLLPILGFSQNIEILKQANDVEAFSSRMLPNYQLIGKSDKGIKTTYIYVPNNLVGSEFEACKIGNPCEKAIVLNYQNNKFVDAKGDYNTLFMLWQKLIQPTTTNKEKTLSYKNNNDKVWFNLVYNNNIGILQNFSERLK